MASELPFFKFEPNQWDNGNIQICTREDKGLFMDLCSMYWSRLGDLPLKLAVQKLCAGNASAFNSLIEENIFAVIDGFICIGFLNEQLAGFKNTSKQNSQNAKDGWDKRRKNKASSVSDATASKPHSEVDAIREEERREDKIRKDKIKEDTIYKSFAHLKITNEEFEKLNEMYDKEIINEVLEKIENYKKNTQYKSLFLTAKNWLKKEKSSAKKENDSGDLIHTN